VRIAIALLAVLVIEEIRLRKEIHIQRICAGAWRKEAERLQAEVVASDSA
jgi:hypothetical protein